MPGRIIVITGPTATGKTSLGVALAERHKHPHAGQRAAAQFLRHDVIIELIEMISGVIQRDADCERLIHQRLRISSGSIRT